MPIEVTSQGMDLEFIVSYEFSTMSYTTLYLPSTLPMWTLISTYLESIMSLKDPKSGRQLFLRLICMCDYLQQVLKLNLHSVIVIQLQYAMLCIMFTLLICMLLLIYNFISSHVYTCAALQYFLWTILFLLVKYKYTCDETWNQLQVWIKVLFSQRTTCLYPSFQKYVRFVSLLFPLMHVHNSGICIC